LEKIKTLHNCALNNFILLDFDWRFFWKWTDFRSYLEFIAAFTLSASVLTYTLVGYVIYVEALGFTSLFIEAMLGIPQFYDNYVSKSTLGMRYYCAHSSFGSESVIQFISQLLFCFIAVGLWCFCGLPEIHSRRSTSSPDNLRFSFPFAERFKSP
jgi:hypothetical protein